MSCCINSEAVAAKPPLMDPDALLACLTRLADHGRLGAPDAPLRLAVDAAFKERARAPRGAAPPPGLYRSTRAVERQRWRDGAARAAQ